MAIQTWTKDAVHRSNLDEDTFYVGSDDDDYDSPAHRQLRYKQAAKKYLNGDIPFILTATLQGPFESSKGWNNPWAKSNTHIPSWKSISKPTISPIKNMKGASKSPQKRLQTPNEGYLPSPESLKQVVLVNDMEHPYLERDELDTVQKWRDSVSQPAIDEGAQLCGKRKRSLSTENWLKTIPDKRAHKRTQLGRTSGNFGRQLDLNTVSHVQIPPSDIKNIDRDRSARETQALAKHQHAFTPPSRPSPTKEMLKLQVKQDTEVSEMSASQQPTVALSSPVSLRNGTHEPQELQNKPVHITPTLPCAEFPAPLVAVIQLISPAKTDGTDKQEQNAREDESPDEHPDTVSSAEDEPIVKMDVSVETPVSAQLITPIIPTIARCPSPTSPPIISPSGCTKPNPDTSSVSEEHDEDDSSVRSTPGCQDDDESSEAESEIITPDAQLAADISTIRHSIEITEAVHYKPEIREATTLDFQVTPQMKSSHDESSEVALGTDHEVELATAAVAVLLSQSSTSNPDEHDADEALQQSIVKSRSCTPTDTVLDEPVLERALSPSDIPLPSTESPVKMEVLEDSAAVVGNPEESAKTPNCDSAKEPSPPPVQPCGTSLDAIYEVETTPEPRLLLPKRFTKRCSHPKTNKQPRPVHESDKSAREQETSQPKVTPLGIMAPPPLPVARFRTPEPDFQVKSFSSFMSPSPRHKRYMPRPNKSGRKSCLAGSRNTNDAISSQQAAKTVTWAIVAEDNDGGERTLKEQSPPPTVSLGDLPTAETDKFANHFSAVVKRTDGLRHKFRSTKQYSDDRSDNKLPEVVQEDVVMETKEDDGVCTATQVPPTTEVEISREREAMSMEPLDVMDDIFGQMGDILKGFDVDAELNQARKQTGQTC